MSQCLLKLALGLALLVPASSDVIIHHHGVRLLAKPFGIEKRIRLLSIDTIHLAADGSMRLDFTLENSGVKEVLLANPSFSFDIILPDGQWASLGQLCGCLITFPVTEDDQKLKRSYTAEFKSELSSKDLTSYLKQAAANGAPMRLLGHADMTVRSGGKPSFNRKGLKLELDGPVILGAKFAVKKHQTTDSMPKLGAR
ncbi:hypothetical protein ACFQY0_16555 [Haloferula chungangensis]|uniref:Late embryogenesis abundant protein LEA-2 subgroup domain-containing protein n=1 Tax=Haloferula chungangensis TaxID=1048331 RepID=A0ABW2LBU5_9BACT